MTIRQPVNTIDDAISFCVRILSCSVLAKETKFCIVLLFHWNVHISECRSVGKSCYFGLPFIHGTV